MTCVLEKYFENHLSVQCEAQATNIAKVSTYEADVYDTEDENQSFTTKTFVLLTRVGKNETGFTLASIALLSPVSKPGQSLEP